MHSRKIGSLECSAVGLGCMNMSMGYGAADERESGDLLNHALDVGYTFFDTAHMYGDGHNEMLVGKYLSDKRQQFVLATKCGLSNGGIDGRPETIVKECNESLSRLKTDVIDLYYLHRADPKVPIEESVGAMAQLVAQGKVRELGLSEICTDTLKRAVAVHKIAAVQSEYSLWSRTPERGIIDTCNAHDIAFVPFSPLGRGFLTGKAADVTQLSDSDLRCTIARPRFEPDAYADNVKLLKPFAETAAQNNCSMAQLALAWLLNRGDNMLPIPGTKHMDFMIENAGASEIKLDTSTLIQLDQLINHDTVVGTRYTENRMAASEAERD
ncbi:MAG: aldo/keto reductase [Granulosicoccaceae bacterium]